MGYRIVYDRELEKHKQNRFRRGQVGLLTAAFFVMFILSVKLFWEEGTDMLWDILLPGNEDITRSAMDQMVAQLRSGVGLKEAVTAFCREIIAGAQLG